MHDAMRRGDGRCPHLSRAELAEVLAWRAAMGKEAIPEQAPMGALRSDSGRMAQRERPLEWARWCAQLAAKCHCRHGD